MIKVIVRVKDKSRIDKMEEFGSIVFISPVLNIISLEMKEENLQFLNNDDNVISYELEPEGRLMYA